MSTRPQTLDPRWDLQADSDAWHYLLWSAEQESDACHEILHFMRCGGLRITRLPLRGRDSGGDLRFEPLYAPKVQNGEGGYIHNLSLWETPADWARDRKMLVPHTDCVKKVLARLKAEWPETLQTLQMAGR